ncbi:MAG: hypothetical protein DMF72_14440 [Acidobacteria bacterium]|nr:MAG: hypothetical protein DMF72_14440 [Acidobacteriota bacterium]
MFKANSQRNEELDRVARVVLKSASAAAVTVEAAATSPFLFTRVRAAISEDAGRAEESGSWLSLILVARRAVPVMALVAIMAAVITIWSAGFSFSSTPAQLDDEALFGPAEPGVEQTVLAKGSGLSREEVLNIVVDRNYEVDSK